jgi:ribosomal protein S27AE
MPKRIYAEINGVFYKSLRAAARTFKCDSGTIKSKCLSNKLPNYKIVPFRVTYMKKKCTKCGKIKLLKKFNKHKKSPDGFRWVCRKCQSKEHIIYKDNNPEKIKKSRIAWGKKSGEYKKEWTANNPKKVKKGQKKYKKKKRKDPAFKINKAISGGICKSLRGNKNNAHWEDLVGWTAEEGRTHLESLFTEGMTWENYGCGKYQWSLDHVKAVSKFNITSNTCQKLRDCWALSNLQPLWHVRNMEKGNRPMHPKYLIKPF